MMEYSDDVLRYEGEWDEGKPNGVGKIVYREKGIYEGEVQDRVPEGKGT